MSLPRSFVRQLLVAGLVASLAACGSLGDGFEVSSAPAPVAGEPPRADGPIPEDFRAFVADFWPTAAAAGVSRATYDAAFAGVGPDQDTLDRASRQAEFVKPIWDYLDGAVPDSRVATGRQQLAARDALLDQIEGRYGVERQYVLAIWGMESTYGTILGDPKIVKNAVRALATLAWKGGRRAKYGRQQLVAVLRILERGDVDARHITGSWAGAMGHTQFIPTTYQAYAVDFDGDGKRNIWTSVPDALASTANYLRKAGWRPGQAWGYEVVLPAGFDRRREGSRMSLSEWRAVGVTRADGKGYPRGEDIGALWMPAGSAGPAFLTLHNFNVIKRYNVANAYALGVGHLADRIAGGGPIVQKWPWGYDPLSETEKHELQALLARRGYEISKVDGKIGPQTTSAIMAYQSSQGVEATGHPSQDVLKMLRAGQ